MTNSRDGVSARYFATDAKSGVSRPRCRNAWRRASSAPSRSSGETTEEREGALDALRHALRQRGLETPDFASVAKYLADTPSRLLVISMEDVLGMRNQVNLPA